MQPSVQKLPIVNTPPSEQSIRGRIYDFAKKCLGKDIARTQNELGCAEAVSYILYSVGALHFPQAGFVGTHDLYLWLLKNATPVKEGAPGDIIISPTGTSTIGAAHGHVGVVAYHGILSNNSMTGLFDEYYTLDKWEAYYVEKLHFPIFYFRVNA